MSCPLGTDEINKLRTFVGFCSTNPQLLNIPQLDFFKEFVEKLGGKVPPPSGPAGAAGCPASDKPKESAPTEPEVAEEAVESDPESEVELDTTGVIEPDNDEPQPMGDETKTPTEEEVDEASELRSQAAAAYSEQKLQEAIDLYTKAIELNPGNALFHAKRGQVYLKLQKPNACIRDCDKALELNCDSAASYKFRGRAHRLLGNWESAAKDLRQACKLDFDEEADEWLKEVAPNAKKLEQHKIKLERKKTEKKVKEQQERARKAQEANKRAREESAKANFGGGGPGGMPFGGGMPDFGQFGSAFEDPELQTAFMDIQQNPANAAKYLGNPKVMAFIQSMMGGGGGMGGMRPPTGGAPDASATGGAAPSTPPPPPPAAEKKPEFTDDGLD